MKEIKTLYGSMFQSDENEKMLFDTEEECEQYDNAIKVFDKEFIKMNSDEDILAHISGGYGAEVRVFRAFEGWFDIVKTAGQYREYQIEAFPNVDVGSVYLLVMDYDCMTVFSIEEIRRNINAEIDSLSEDMAYAIARKERADGCQKDDV